MSMDMFPDDFVEFLIRHRNCQVEGHDPTTCDAAETGETFTTPGGTLGNVHKAEKCDGRPCIVHNPTEHHMRNWPLVWRAFRGQFERTCPHGIGHPDPDQIGDMTHGCDGCCHE
jgi:hypothetical protein